MRLRRTSGIVPHAHRGHVTRRSVARSRPGRRRPPIKVVVSVGETVEEIEVGPFTSKGRFWQRLVRAAEPRSGHAVGQGCLLVPCPHCRQLTAISEREFRSTRRRPVLDTVCLRCHGVFEARAAVRAAIKVDGARVLLAELGVLRPSRA